MKKIIAVLLISIMFLSLTSLSEAAHKDRGFYRTALVSPVVCGKVAARTVLYTKPYYNDYCGHCYRGHRYYNRYYRPYRHGHKYYRPYYHHRTHYSY